MQHMWTKVFILLLHFLLDCEGHMFVYRYAIRQSLQYHMRSMHGKDSEEDKPTVTSPTISSTNLPTQYDCPGQRIASSTDDATLNLQWVYIFVYTK